MGKAQKKTGKGRLDKYYKLAKEQGYRARSAFKLIQLNKKFSFLENARCCIDLCAAPGGWLQVASKYMPPSSIIVGVDLVAIKPIPRVSTFAADITTPQCRNLIRGELKDWKADVVLHDGAPNVGTAWVQDAFGQSELVLMSLKLAVEFLMKGGTFVTKVFRSADYNSLMWVFNQLFGKVEATKPPSSRNVSAEIFVVCQDFLAPKTIDPKFLDPKHVFKELAASIPTDGKLTISANAQANVFQPDKKRRQRDGYAEGDYTLFKAIGASEFIRSSDPVSVLGSANRITFATEEEKEWLAIDITNSDVKANCEDLKVLGKGDFKILMKWRSTLRETVGLDNKAKPTEELTEKVEIDTEVNEDEEMEKELARVNAEAAAKAKRERRKANESKQRTIRRMQLRMTAPMDIGMDQYDPSLDLGQEDVFELDDSSSNKRNPIGMSEDVEMLADEDEQMDDNGSNGGDDGDRLEELENELDNLYDAYKERRNERDAKFKAKEARSKNKHREEWSGFKAHNSDEDSDSEDEIGGWEEMNAVKAAGESSSESDSDSDNDEMTRKRVSKNGADTRKRRKLLVDLKPKSNGSTNLWFDQDIFNDINMDEIEDENSSHDSEGPQEVVDDLSEETDDDFEVVPQARDEDMGVWDADDTDEDEEKRKLMPDLALTTAETVTLAQQLVNRQKTKSQLVDDGFSRYTLNSKEGLPSWFLDDEAQFYKPNIPITKEAMDMLRARQRALDARPIKKIAEAKARKKFKAVQKLQKAMKKAEGVNGSTDMSEREKAQQIQKLMKSGLSKANAKRKSEIKVVVAKGAHRGVKGRPKGVKGRYQMVDARMRKEVRAKKRKEKASKKR